MIRSRLRSKHLKEKTEENCLLYSQQRNSPKQLKCLVSYIAVKIIYAK